MTDKEFETEDEEKDNGTQFHCIHLLVMLGVIMSVVFFVETLTIYYGSYSLVVARELEML